MTTINQRKFTCSVEECQYSSFLEPYGSCQECNKINICSKRDKNHDNALLYNEGCRDHHGSGYSVCIKCSLEAFQKKEYKNYEHGNEHCICPNCCYDFGLLKDIPNTEKIQEELNLSQDFSCSIEGCVPGKGLYGMCNNCQDFSICYRGIDEPEHKASLLYNEGCREHHGDGYSVCINCALHAYRNITDNIIEEHCICPVCEYDFGIFSKA